MEASLAGLFLLGTIIFVTARASSYQLDENKPLNVDKDLPFPWAGHASSVISLTALFSTYLGLGLFLGPFTVLGACGGTLAALMFLRSHIQRHSGYSFEEYLCARSFSTDPKYDSFMWIFLATTQLGFLVSELVLFAEVIHSGFEIGRRDAVVISLTVSLVAYFYCLTGGYRAIYETDIIQAAFMLLMSLALASTLLYHGVSTPVTKPIDPELWTFGVTMPQQSKLPLQFLFGGAMGFGYLLSTPDTWKRVFVLVKHTSGRSSSPLGFALGALMPFLLLIPFFFLPHGESALDDVNPISTILGLAQREILAGVLLLGMFATFLSSFDSSLISATHVSLLYRRHLNPQSANSQAAFYQQLGWLYLAGIVLALFSVQTFQNPYLPANLLLANYAILSAYVLGTGLLESPTRSGSTPWLAVLAVAAWFVYVLSIPDVLTRPVPRQIDTLFVGVLIFFGFALLLMLRRYWGGSDANGKD